MRDETYLPHADDDGIESRASDLPSGTASAHDNRRLSLLLLLSGHDDGRASALDRRTGTSCGDRSHLTARTAAAAATATRDAETSGIVKQRARRRCRVGSWRLVRHGCGSSSSLTHEFRYRVYSPTRASESRSSVPCSVSTSETVVPCAGQHLTSEEQGEHAALTLRIIITTTIAPSDESIRDDSQEPVSDSCAPDRRAQLLRDRKPRVPGRTRHSRLGAARRAAHGQCAQERVALQVNCAQTRRRESDDARATEPLSLVAAAAAAGAVSLLVRS